METDPTGPSATRRRFAVNELIIGILLVAAVLGAGAFFAFRPRPVVVDGWFSFLVTSAKGTWFTGITVLRYPAVIVVGATAAAALTFRRDRPRAVACLLGPCLALLTSELVIKPAVGRTLGGVYSYPSGSTVGAAALAVAVVLAVPGRWRPVVAGLASIYALWMALAVVAMQWHLPTDAVAGLAYGAGVVLVIDAAASMVAVRLGRMAVPADPAVGRRVSSPVSEGRPDQADVLPSAPSDGVRRITATVFCGLSGSKRRSMGPSGWSGVGGLDHEGHLRLAGFEGLAEPHGDAGHHRPGGRPFHPIVEPKRILSRFRVPAGRRPAPAPPLRVPLSPWSSPTAPPSAAPPTADRPAGAVRCLRGILHAPTVPESFPSPVGGGVAVGPASLNRIVPVKDRGGQARTGCRAGGPAGP